jgi:hypothetical protein
MSRCQGCAKPGHGPGECENQGLPMCARACACRHAAAESDPAPYWTAAALEAGTTEGAGV